MKDKEAYDVLDGFYILGEELGCGGFGKVKKATHLETGERVAIKIMDKRELGLELPRVTNEIDTIKTLDHPYICKLYQVIQDDRYIFMVLEYCRGGEVFDYIVQRDRLDETESRRVFRQILSAVSYLHDRGVVHRDLKPENIMLDECTNVKLIDFGLAIAPIGGLSVNLNTLCGSPTYVAPELVKGDPYTGAPVDVWALGVILYALLNGFLPFCDPDVGKLYKKILVGKYDEPKWLSEGAKNILRCMLQIQPERRLSVKELLSHTWCQQGNPERLPLVNATPCRPQTLDLDVLNKMSRLPLVYSSHGMERLKEKLEQWDFNSHELSTYSILVARKKHFGLRTFDCMPICLSSRKPLACERVKKSLEEFYSDADDVDAIPAATGRSYHASSMEGGLDDQSLLLMGSPKLEDKENDEEFLPTPRKSSKNDVSVAMNNLSPARSADSFLQEPKTPARERWKNITTPVKQSAATGSPSSKVCGSIERGLNRFRDMLTPKSSRTQRKIRTIGYGHTKRVFNVSSTMSTDPDCVISELKEALAKIGIESEQKGYSLIGKWTDDNGKRGKFELEVVAFDNSDMIGIRRKRQNGDAWRYKQIVEQVLGVCQLRRDPPIADVLQTDV